MTICFRRRVSQIVIVPCAWQLLWISSSLTRFPFPRREQETPQRLDEIFQVFQSRRFLRVLVSIYSRLPLSRESRLPVSRRVSPRRACRAPASRRGRARGNGLVVVAAVVDFNRLGFPGSAGGRFCRRRDLLFRRRFGFLFPRGARRGRGFALRPAASGADGDLLVIVIVTITRIRVLNDVVVVVLVSFVAAVKVEGVFGFVWGFLPRLRSRLRRGDGSGGSSWRGRSPPGPAHRDAHRYDVIPGQRIVPGVVVQGNHVVSRIGIGAFRRRFTRLLRRGFGFRSRGRGTPASRRKRLPSSLAGPWSPGRLRRGRSGL